MKRQIITKSCFIVALFCSSTLAEPLSLNQDFDSAGGWSFTADPVAYNEEDGTDLWETLTELGDITSGNPGSFWGMQDLQNDGSGGSFDHVLTFGSVDVSQHTNVQISFDYNAVAWDGGDDMRYDVIVDGVSQGVVDFFEGASGGVGSSGWTTQTIAVPDIASSVEFKLLARQNGQTDFGGWDNVSITGSMVPEPSGMLLLALGAVMLRRRSTRVDV